MTNRPTQSPLTGSERAALDDLIRRGAGALNSAEQNRLLRLWQADQADRQQERRTARGMDKANQVLRRQLREAAVERALSFGEPRTSCDCSRDQAVAGDEMGDALRRISDEVARHRAGGDL